MAGRRQETGRRQAGGLSAWRSTGPPFHSLPPLVGGFASPSLPFSPPPPFGGAVLVQS